MTSSLIQTKFYFPTQRPTYITRPRFREYLSHEFFLDDRFNRKLTLICAPAGYGKTSLAIEWLTTLQIPVAWLSLDEGDNDPVRFLSYLLNALRQILPEVGGPSSGMLQSPQLPAPEELMAPLLNEIGAADCPFVFVIDDYHLIQSPAIHPYLNFLIEYQPREMHTVIISREDPPLPLHRLRGRGHVVEVRQDQIRFNLDETTTFLRTFVSQELTAENIQDIEHRTEGWVTGMQLLALSLQQQADANEFIQSFSGSDRFVLDYLFEEVFNQQSEKNQDFLLKSAILKNLSASVCQAVTGYEDSREILEWLDQSNLFVQHLEQSQTWYRYHRLFHDLLKHRLRIDRHIDQQALHRKASQWHEQHGQLEDAVNHALAGSDWENGLALIEQLSDQLLKTGSVATILGWQKEIPVDYILENPTYCLTFAWPLLLSGQENAADLYLETAERKAVDHPELLGAIASAQAFQAQTRGDENRMVAYSERALSLLPVTDLSARSIVAMNLGIAYWHQGEMSKAEQTLQEALNAASQTDNKYAELTALFFIGRVHAVRGRLHQAAQIFDTIADLNIRMPIVALVYLDLSMLNYEHNQLEASEKLLNQAIELISPSQIEFQLAALMQKSRILTANGQPQKALDLVLDFIQTGRSAGLPPRSQGRLASCIVETAIACDNLELATSWSEKASTGSDSHPFYRFLVLSPVRMQLAHGKTAETLEMLETLANKASAAGWEYGTIALRAMQALTALDILDAVAYLTEALSRAHREKYLRTFVDLGPALVPVLQEAKRRGVFPDTIAEILAAFEVQPDSPGVSTAIDPLSERELEVLRLLAMGHTNRQIAEQLIISISTVKSHVHHISAKLDASNRTEAVANARQLGIL